MKLAVMVFIMALFSWNGAANACSIVNEEKVQIGDSQGVKGTCSNNGLPISCEYTKDGNISCDGPGGGYSGDDLRSLVFSACGCSAQEEKERKLKKGLESGK
jgi:hypothetical protein